MGAYGLMGPWPLLGAQATSTWPGKRFGNAHEPSSALIDYLSARSYCEARLPAEEMQR